MAFTPASGRPAGSLSRALAFCLAVVLVVLAVAPSHANLVANIHDPVGANACSTVAAGCGTADHHAGDSMPVDASGHTSDSCCIGLCQVGALPNPLFGEIRLPSAQRHVLGGDPLVVSADGGPLLRPPRVSALLR
jgi:hypothetical protein